ncbi:MAG: BON domain-containing protein, partial [Phycisphaera sp. RhM]|nr:BON domain-containing protein [Phycisphaera sp. RhM]
MPFSRFSGVFAIVLFGCAFAVPDGSLASEKVNGAISAQTVTDAVEDEFLFDTAVPTTIDVETVEGVVTLSGTVGNMLAKQRAERLAMLVKGVRAVVNRIEVRPSVQIASTSLKTDVTRALALDAATANSKVTVP